MASVDTVLERLQAKADPGRLPGMAGYGLTGQARLGVSIPDLRQIAREVGQDHDLALALWQTGIPEARILASMVDRPGDVTEAQADAWVADFDAWDVCDQVCMNLLEKLPWAWSKIAGWSERDEEFVRRAAFALLACLAWHDKAAADEHFLALLPVVEAGATDGRNYVKKAVSWALRNIGKRNPALHAAALETAARLRALDSPPSRWIAADVERDLGSPATLRRLEGSRPG
jgi:3-methyladenine DNA glycosylase AlkD